MSHRLASESIEPTPVAIGAELDPRQQEALLQPVQGFPTVLLVHQGWTQLVSNHITTIPDQKVHDHHQPLLKKMWNAVH